MNTKDRTVKREFPNSTIGIVSQTGAQLADRAIGVTVELHYLPGASWPHSAEVYGGDHYCDLGLEWEGNRLTGYDGAFDLPGEVMEMLTELGADTTQL